MEEQDNKQADSTSESNVTSSDAASTTSETIQAEAQTKANELIAEAKKEADAIIKSAQEAAEQKAQQAAIEQRIETTQSQYSAASPLPTDKTSEFNLLAQNMLQQMVECKGKVQRKIEAVIEEANDALTKTALHTESNIKDLIEQGKLEENLRNAELKIEVQIEKGTASINNLIKRWNLDEHLESALSELDKAHNEGLESIKALIATGNIDEKLTTAIEKIDATMQESLQKIEAAASQNDRRLRRLEVQSAA